MYIIHHVSICLLIILSIYYRYTFYIILSALHRSGAWCPVTDLLVHCWPQIPKNAASNLVVYGWSEEVKSPCVYTEFIWIYNVHACSQILWDSTIFQGPCALCETELACGDKTISLMLLRRSCRSTSDRKTPNKTPNLEIHWNKPKSESSELQTNFCQFLQGCSMHMHRSPDICSI